MEDFQIVIIALCVFSPCFICVCFWVCICFPSGNSPSAPYLDNLQSAPRTNNYPSIDQQILARRHQNYSFNEVINMQPSAPSSHDLATYEDLPPSYVEVMKKELTKYP